MKNKLSEAASIMGKQGGKKTAQRGEEYFREIQRLGVEARKKNQNMKQETIQKLKANGIFPRKPIRCQECDTLFQQRSSGSISYYCQPCKEKRKRYRRTFSQTGLHRDS